MPKKELEKLIGFSLIVSVAALYGSTKIPATAFIQCSLYLVIIFVWLIGYLAYFVRKYHLNENYRNLVTYKNLVVIVISIIVFILIIDFIFYYEPKVVNFFTQKFVSKKSKNIDIKTLVDTINGGLKFLTSSSVVALFTYLISKINDYKKVHTLEIQLFNTATFSKNAETIIPNDTKRINLSLHNFSNNIANIFFLGICKEDVAGNVLEKKGWDKNFIDGKLPKGPKSLEKITPDNDSKLQIIDVSKLREALNSMPSFDEDYGYRLCAVYYVQEGENTNLSIIKKHFILEYSTDEKDEESRLNNLKTGAQCYQIAEQIRKYASVIPNKDYKKWALQVADRIDPTVANDN